MKDFWHHPRRWLSFVAVTNWYVTVLHSVQEKWAFTQLAFLIKVFDHHICKSSGQSSNKSMHSIFIAVFGHLGIVGGQWSQGVLVLRVTLERTQVTRVGVIFWQ